MKMKTRYVSDLLLVLLLIFSEFKRIQLLLPLKSSENFWFSDDVRGHKKLLNSLKSS